MVASLLQPADSGLLLMHSVPISGNAHQPSGESHFARGNGLTDIPGGLAQCEKGGVHWGRLCAPHRQEQFWRQFSFDPFLWWDYRTLAALDTPPSPSSLTLPKNAGPRRVTVHVATTAAEAVSNLCDKGQLSEAVDALEVLVHTESHLSIPLFYTVLKACVAQKNLGLGRHVHRLATAVGYESNTFLATHILRMYASHGRLPEAKGVFSKLTRPDAFSWSAVIAAHAKHGEPKQAIELYQQMRSSSVKPDGHVFVAALQACATTADLESGKKVHADVLDSGIEPNEFVWNSLVDMYAKCGRLEEARAVLESLATKNVVAWNAILDGYAKCGRLEDARRVFDSLATRNVVTCNTMITGYAKCGRLEDARRLFDTMATRNVVTWNAMIAAYAQHGLGQEALALFARMEQDGMILGNGVTFTCLLKLCATSAALPLGKQLHSQILERGLQANIVVGTCLVNMYVNCGRLEDAHTVFDSLPRKDVVAWTAMIAGYAQHGLSHEALALFDEMEREGLILANPFTFACLLKACAAIGALRQGKQLHAQIVEQRLEADTVVGTCLVDMYVKCGRLDDAYMVFDSLATKNVVTWSAMIAGYADYGLCQKALALYYRMEQDGRIWANSFIFACLLRACASVAALQQGKYLHSQIVERGLEVDLVLGNCLVDMYAKCGSLKNACTVFDCLPTKNVVTWTIMIHGFGQCSEAQNAIKCFENMMRDGIKADETTFTCLLVACSHEGLVNEGAQLFKAMVDDCRIMPTVEHYTCIVDLLGRASYLDSAEKMLFSFRSDDVGFMSLLNACRSYGDVQRGWRCFKSLVRSDPQNAAAFVVMGDIFAAAGRWSDVQRVERLRKLAGATKKPAVANIEVDRYVHSFVVGEGRGDIALKARTMNTRLKEDGGHVPNTGLVLKPLHKREKEDELCGHAEKLALAYGLLNTLDGTPLLVTKNMRMCANCHSSTEVMSRLEKREIVVRDAYRVHRFLDGSCSCGGRP